MAFVVKKINLDDLSNTTEKFTHEPTGLEVTFKSFNDKSFQKAYSLLMARDKADLVDLKEKPLDDSFLDGINGEDGTTNELLIRSIAKFLITDWNAVDEDSNKLEVNGDNFVLLISNVDDPSELISWCFTCAGDVAMQKSKEMAETKKKPSRVTSGKKTSQE